LKKSWFFCKLNKNENQTSPYLLLFFIQHKHLVLTSKEDISEENVAASTFISIRRSIFLAVPYNAICNIVVLANLCDQEILAIFG